ncbi:uncharacterized protein At1g28695-like [Henckelia pumila]|uniref:uncharacterized protein At1g28695-like n=1 Tax=Henckelia pumila TaxID=405737 RepID=UPI003C6E17B2
MVCKRFSIVDLLVLALCMIFAATFFFLISWIRFSPNSTPLPNTDLEIISRDELEIALENAAMAGSKNLFIAFINRAYVEPHENEYPSMLDLFLEGFWEGEGTRQLLDHLLVVAMDKAAHERCEYRRLNCYMLDGDGDGDGDGDDFAGEKIYMTGDFIEMMWIRTSFLLNVLKKGYNFIFTDTDVLWLRNPLTRLSMNETFDLQISADSFNGNSSSELNHINTGFYYVRSNKRTISLFETWYDMRNNSTGMKEQDVLEQLVSRGILDELDVTPRFLDTLYFSGFCSDSQNVNMVVTVHANCCRTIGAKMVDLKAVLRDWEGFKNNRISDDGFSFRWTNHSSCINSWVQ